MKKRPSPKPASKRPAWAVNSSYLLPVVFVIAFAGIGMSLLYGGHAETPCTKQTLRQGMMNDCVLQVQKILDVTADHWGGGTILQDSVFDTQTQTQLEKFQAIQMSTIPDGVVDQNTWQALCHDDNVWHGSESAFNNAGCEVAFGVSWGAGYSSDAN